MHDFGSQIGLEYKLLPEIHQVDRCIRLLLEQPSIAQLSAIFAHKKPPKQIKGNNTIIIYLLLAIIYNLYGLVNCLSSFCS